MADEGFRAEFKIRLEQISGETNIGLGVILTEASTNPFSCTTTCDGKLVGCDSKEECGGGACCLRLVDVLATNVCPYPVPFANFKETACASGCGGANEYLLCAGASDCPAPTTCSKVEISGSGDKLSISVCR